MSEKPQQGNSWVSELFLEFREGSALKCRVAAVRLVAWCNISTENGPKKLLQASFSSYMDGKNPEVSLVYWKIIYWILAIYKALF